MTKKDETRELVPVNDDTSLEALFDLVTTGEQPKYLSYIPGLFTTASLPFKNVKKTVFTRKGSQGLTLTLTSPINVPFGRYGRLLLTVLTTHAVLSKEKNVPVMIEYNSLSELLKEMQLPRQRGKDIKEQLDCFTNATFAFTHKETTLKSGYLFKDIYEDGNYPKKDVEVTTKTTGSIRFTTGVQFQEIDDKVTEKKYGNFKIVISAEFANFCQLASSSGRISFVLFLNPMAISIKKASKAGYSSINEGRSSYFRSRMSPWSSIAAIQPPLQPSTPI